MSTKETGGPAFPATEEHGLNSGMPGMELRDYFAAQAMPLAMKMISDNFDKANHPWKWERDLFMAVSRRSYNLADAMMEARKS